MEYYPYGEKETSYLTKRDKKLGALIARIGPIQRPMQRDLFTAIMEAMVGQQVSNKSKATVMARLRELLGPRLTPETMLDAGRDKVQACGLSWRKVDYMLGAAQAVASGALALDTLASLSDDEVIAELSGLAGIGPWTAEMLLLSCLGRPDVFSYGDLAIRRAMMRLYNLEALPRDVFEKYRKRYSPHGSVASLYFWRFSGM